MKFIYNNKISKYFFVKNHQYVDINPHTKIDLIISPEFYWVRKFMIPVKTKRKAREYLPNLFEEVFSCDNDDSIEYFCEKIEENQYLSFAINRDLLFEEIEKSGILLFQIRNIYLAQGQLKEYSSFKFNEEFFTFYNDILIKIPKSFDLEFYNLSNPVQNNSVAHKINLKAPVSLLLKREYSEIIILLLFMTIMLNIFKYVNYNKEIKINYQYIENTKQSNNLPSSNLRFVSILEELERQDVNSKKINKTINDILFYKKLNSNLAVLETLSYKNDKLIFSFKNVNQKEIEEYFKEKIDNFKVKIANDIIEIEVLL